jgi:hypothetical protein
VVEKSRCGWNYGHQGPVLNTRKTLHLS